MQKQCTQCRQEFIVTDQDVQLLDKLSPEIQGKKFSLPVPDMCFECRLQRRLAFYNCRSLYRRKCGKTDKDIVSIFSPDKKCTVYDRDIWYGDSWDPMQYGRSFDFSKPFFEQIQELMHVVPLPSRAVLGENVNSDYTNDNWKLKNCYLVFDCEQGEDCMYGQTFEDCTSCMDFLTLNTCELCYECTNCQDSYNLRYSQFCNNCNDSWFLRDCIGCKQCFGCTNMRQKQYCIFNEQNTKGEYEKFLQSFESRSYKAVQSMQKSVQQLQKNSIVKSLRGTQNIDCLGDNIHESKNAHRCYDSSLLQDCSYMTNCLMGAKDSMDIHIWGLGMELCYQGAVVGANTQRSIGCYYLTEGANNVFYSLYCSRNVMDLLGCIGLRHKQYCILNMQYTKQEYQELASKIIEHMQDTGEWGQFFPETISAFGYNETMAQTYFPLSKEEVLKRNWKWSNYEMIIQAEKTIQASKLPDSTADVPDDILNWAILCEVTGKPFKIVKQELEFYREHSLPLPRRHPDQRHNDRCAYKNSYKLWKRQCSDCGTGVETSYSPEREERVVCEHCYERIVY